MDSHNVSITKSDLDDPDVEEDSNDEEVDPDQAAMEKAGAVKLKEGLKGLVKGGDAQLKKVELVAKELAKPGHSYDVMEDIAVDAVVAADAMYELLGACGAEGEPPASHVDQDQAIAEFSARDAGHAVINAW